MKRKGIMGRGKRAVLLFLAVLLTALAAGCAAAIYANSFITVEGTDGTVSYFISPLAQKALFEDTEIFDDIFTEDVRDVTRMAVIRSQLETDGVYDGKKRIDIAAYVNRTNTLGENAVTAEYYLDDLVRWSNFGFRYKTVYGTQEEFDRCFATGTGNMAESSDLSMGDYSLQTELTRQAIKNSVQAAGTDLLSLRIIAEMPESMEEWLDRAGENGDEPDAAAVLAVDILVPRYYSADGGDLADYASSLEEYISLRNNLVDAGNQLCYNFTEYSSFKNYYGWEQTNIRYCYQMEVDGELCLFTNMQKDFSGMTEKEITEYFSAFGRSLYYNPDQVELRTDTSLTAEEMRAFLGYYEYAFGEGSRVWIGVDTSYPADDSLARARNAFMRFMPYYWQTVGAAALAAILAVWILVVLTVYEGRRAKEEGEGYEIFLRRGDRIPTEFLAAAMVLTGACMAALAAAFGKIVRYREYGILGEEADPFLLAAGAAVIMFLLDWAAAALYLGLVRRLKAHIFWKGALIWRLGRLLRRGAFSLYEHSSIVSRELIPFFVIVLFNLCMGFFGKSLGILAAGIVDVAAGCLLYLERKDLQSIVEGTQTIGGGSFEAKIDASRMHGENRALAEAVNSIGDGIQDAVATSMKDERLKADLITNVSHDIKTPLTSIINFVKLLKREDIRDERIRGYIEVLDAKSQRLKQLTDDLVEASKISSGNISLQMERINFVELINQTIGEFAEKMEGKCLQVIPSMPEGPVCIEADSRRIWRVVENLFGNVCKYALEGTRVYLDLTEQEENGRKTAVFSMKNISAQPLNIRADELTERFIRGDVSRSTEGSGLGLSIAKNLTELQNGRFEIYLDGDLFKVILAFPCMEAARPSDRSKLPEG
ncbi:MAG TPA: HAMP domain-containing histidine kinase [Candidatus Eisenbergiella intestinipullorum]|nr:HAMP domain-containing histidine kinase [Candidatus Eisenbergiella intestinipullorum]